MEKKETEEENEKLEREIRRNRIIKIILILIIIIILFLLCLLALRIGRIGFDFERTSTEETDLMDIITITDEDVSWDKDTELNIFSSLRFDDEKKVAPWSYGTYQFCVKNEVDSDIMYSIHFSDLMSNPVNMVYKLKIDNVYVRGDSENYVSIDELDLDNIIVLEGSNNIFTLEWYWADDDENDTYTGSQAYIETQYYTLNLRVDAELYTKEEEWTKGNVIY